MLDLEQNEKAFINRIVYGTIEYKIKLDYIINLFSNTKTNKLKLAILILLRMSIYQMLYMDHVPHSAIINEAVKLVKKRKINNLAGFLNGVLRNISRNISTIEYPSEQKEPNRYLSITYSFPSWLVDYLLEQYDYLTVKNIFEDTLKMPKICIRHNTIKGSVEALIDQLEKEGVSISKGNILPYAFYLEGTGNIKNLQSFQKGLFQVQDESSMLVGEIANPMEGISILDICAAPGGKTTHIAQLLNNSGMVLSRDISDKKIIRIEENCSRLGIKNVVLEKYDATELDESLINKMDIVLADVPCSGLGIIKKKPDIKYNVSLAGIESLIKMQRNILNNAAKYVKKEGFLIYSTCTINKNENDENMKWFLEQHPEFEIIPIKYDNINDNKDGFLQILPINELSDGFFIAKLKRMK